MWKPVEQYMLEMMRRLISWEPVLLGSTAGKFSMICEDTSYFSYFATSSLHVYLVKKKFLYNV